MNIPILLMILLAGLFVVVPLFRSRGIEKTADNEIRDQKNIEVFKQRVTELEEDLTEELITQEEFEKIKAELQRAFINDMEEAKTGNALALSQSNKMLPLALLLVVFVFSFFFYQSIGSGQDLVIPELLTEIQSAETEEQQIQSINELAEALDSRFQRHSDNIQNGYTLGTIYLNQEEFPDAIRIFSQLLDEMDDSPDKATVYGQLAQAQYLRADSEMTPDVKESIDLALALDSNEQAVMSLLAIDALVSLNFTEAISYWRRQLLQLSPNSAEAAQIRERIATVEMMMPEEERSAIVEQTSGSSVTVRVEVDDSIKDQIADDMRLFIFARGETMPMPLAAQTFSLDELPLTITLDDSMAMTPQFTLSSAETVYVGARISRVATAQSGDFQAISETFVVEDQEDVVTLLIKDIVP